MISRLLVCVLACFLTFRGRGDITLTTCTELSLRNAVAAGGVIQLSCPSGTIQLTEPLVVRTNTTILATNSVLVISGNNVTRLFVVNPGVELTVSNVALFSGRHTGTNFNDGGIPDTAGAGIYNNGGTVRLFGTTVSSHVVVGTTGFPGGPGLEAGEGEPGGDAAGAAIFNLGGSVMASNVVFASNSAIGGVGGNGGDGSGGMGGEGGDGGNGGSAGGAAIYSQGGSVELFRCVFTNNVATGAVAGNGGAGSGVFGFNGRPGLPGDGVGGAIAGDSTSKVRVDSCSLLNNSVTGANGGNGLAGLRNLEGDDGRDGGQGAGGAIYALGELNLINSTLNGNSASGGNGGNGGNGAADAFGTDGGDGGNGGIGSGGAVEASGVTRIINSTFANNIASGGDGGAAGQGTGVADDGKAGQAGAALGGSVSSAGGDFGMANTIVSESIPQNASGTITDLGGNISSDASGGFVHAASRSSVDPVLRPLSTEGTYIMVLPLGTNSPAINAGLMEFCPPVDQRGSNRWHACDIGAFEFNGGMLVTPTNISLTIGGSILTTNLTNRLAVFWPTNAHNLSLFMATNLPTTNWTQVTLAPITVESNRVVTVPTTNAPRRFFRLGEGTNSTSGPPTPPGGGPPIPP